MCQLRNFVWGPLIFWTPAFAGFRDWVQGWFRVYLDPKQPTFLDIRKSYIIRNPEKRRFFRAQVGFRDVGSKGLGIGVQASGFKDQGFHQIPDTVDGQTSALPILRNIP